MKIPFITAIVIAQLLGFSFEDLGRELSCMIHSESSACRNSESSTESRASSQQQSDPKDHCIDVAPEFEGYYNWDATISYEAIDKITQSGYLYRNELIALAGSQPTCRVEGSVAYTLDDGSKLDALIYGWSIEGNPDVMFLVAVHPAHGDYLAGFNYLPNIAAWRDMNHIRLQPLELQQTIQL